MLLAPLVLALREAGHEVGAVLRTSNADLYRPEIVRSHVLERSERFARCAQELHAGGYDVALIATEKAVAYRLARAARIQRRVGFWNGIAKPLKSAWVYPQIQRRILRGVTDGKIHEVDKLFMLGGGMHDQALATHESKRLRPLFLAREPEQIPELLMQLSPKWLQWFSRDDLTDIVNKLAASAKRRNLGFCCVAGASEHELLRAVSEVCGTPGVVYTDSRHWIERVAGAQVLVTPDTGAAHVAGMVGTPVIDIFPDNASPRRRRRWRPWASPSILISAGEFRDAIGNEGFPSWFDHYFSSLREACR